MKPAGWSQPASVWTWGRGASGRTTQPALHVGLHEVIENNDRERQRDDRREADPAGQPEHTKGQPDHGNDDTEHPRPAARLPDAVGDGDVEQADQKEDQPADGSDACEYAARRTGTVRARGPDDSTGDSTEA